MRFNVNNKRYAGRIIADTYDVNSLEEYFSRYDVRYWEHRRYRRERISGTFDMFFLNAAELAEFRAHLKACRDPKTGAHKLYLSVNNLQTEKEGMFFVDFTLLRTQTAPMIEAYQAFTVTIKER